MTGRISLAAGIGAIALAISPLSLEPSAQPGVSLTFLANEGVMLTAAGVAVLHTSATFVTTDRGTTRSASTPIAPTCTRRTAACAEAGSSSSQPSALVRGGLP